MVMACSGLDAKNIWEALEEVKNELRGVVTPVYDQQFNAYMSQAYVEFKKHGEGIPQDIINTFIELKLKDHKGILEDSVLSREIQGKLERQDEIDRSNQKEGIERLRKSEEILQDSESRLHALHESLHHDPIYYVRSLHQPNSWLCSHFLLYNAFFVQHIANQDKGAITTFRLLNTDLWKEYSYEAFKRNYRETFNIYRDRGVAKAPPYDSDLGISVFNQEEISKNHLDGDEIFKARKLSKSPKSYPIFVSEGQAQFIFFDFEDPIGRDMFEKSATDILKDIYNDRKNWLVKFFACREGRDEASQHWILLSLVHNMKNDSISMIIMDSANAEIKGHSHIMEYINIFKEIFHISSSKDVGEKEDVEDVEREKGDPDRGVGKKEEPVSEDMEDGGRGKEELDPQAKERSQFISSLKKKLPYIMTLPFAAVIVWRLWKWYKNR